MIGLQPVPSHPSVFSIICTIMKEQKYMYILLTFFISCQIRLTVVNVSNVCTNTLTLNTPESILLYQRHKHSYTISTLDYVIATYV